MQTISLSGLIAILLGALSAACAETATGNVRVFATEPACFEFLFTGVSASADGKPVLSFNYRNDRTYFIRPGEQLGPYRITGFEAKSNSVFYPSLNACLDKPFGCVTLAGPGNTTIILEQNRPLPSPGRTAWLVKLDNGAWWNINEQDIFSISNNLIFVEEIDEDGVVVTAGQDLAFIRRITPGEKDELQKLWADLKHDEESKETIAMLRREDAARAKAQEKESAARTTYLTYNKPGPQVEIRGPPRFFYGTEYRFPTSFKVCPGTYTVDGRFISVPCVIPASFGTRYSGISITAP